ncbi:MAG: hypothetical protein R2784_03545 [Saprospiraceae bacterium]
MKDKHTNRPSHKGYFKGTKKSRQLANFYKFLQIITRPVLWHQMPRNSTEKPLSLQKNFRKNEMLWGTKAICLVTGFQAWYLTTNPGKAPRKNQLSLFE